MGAAEEWAREAGCHAMWIRSGTQRTEAHEFYRARGYTDLKRQIVLVKALVEDIADQRLGPHHAPPTMRPSTSEPR